MVQSGVKVVTKGTPEEHKDGWHWRLVDLNELLSQVDAEFFDIASRDVDSDKEHEQLGHPEGIEQLDEYFFSWK